MKRIWIVRRKKMPEVPRTEPYETTKGCPICAKSPSPRLWCLFETIFAGTNKTRHLECKVCGYRTQDVINSFGKVILDK